MYTKAESLVQRHVRGLDMALHGREGTMKRQLRWNSASAQEERQCSPPSLGSLPHRWIHRHPPVHLILLRTGCVSKPRRWYLKIANVSPGISGEFSINCADVVRRNGSQINSPSPSKSSEYYLSNIKCQIKLLWSTQLDFICKKNFWLKMDKSKDSDHTNQNSGYLN